MFIATSFHGFGNIIDDIQGLNDTQRVEMMQVLMNDASQFPGALSRLVSHFNPEELNFVTPTQVLQALWSDPMNTGSSGYVTILRTLLLNPMADPDNEFQNLNIFSQMLPQLNGTTRTQVLQALVDHLNIVARLVQQLMQQLSPDMNVELIQAIVRDPLGMGCFVDLLHQLDLEALNALLPMLDPTTRDQVIQTLGDNINPEI